jgi:hypothetical protein
MVEIAISIAIVAFALVAIIGVLPTGLNVQKDNREDAAINRDGAFLLEAIKQGSNAVNFDMLSNNFVYATCRVGTAGVLYTNYNAQSNLSPLHIIGLLSRPSVDAAGFANVSRAQFRAFSGPLSDMASNAQTLAFSFQAEVKIQPVFNYLDPAAVAQPPGSANYSVPLSNYHRYLASGPDSTNLWDVQLTIQSPAHGATPGSSVGPRRQFFRTLVHGSLDVVTDNQLGNLYYFRASAHKGR